MASQHDNASAGAWWRRLRAWYALRSFPSKLIIFHAVALALCWILLLIAVSDTVRGFSREFLGDRLLPYTVVALGMLLFGISIVLQVCAGLVRLWRFRHERVLPGILALVTAPLFAFAAAAPTLGLMLSGGAWGRPLRMRGRQLHPELREGADWTQGEMPDASGLDEPTRRALEALWLHDAQKEHASVPAFSRISWLLAAVGAPAELMEWSHRAALEEIDHTRRCFALAAGYGGRSHSVEAMPDLLIGALELKADPMIVLAEESLKDGCQLEDFNADVAAACAEVCREPATRDVLERIAREERSHAEFSWALLAWTLERGPRKVRPAILKALEDLRNYRRPTAVSWDKKALVEKADPALLLSHGRLPDARWDEIWELRLKETEKRLREMLALPQQEKAAA